MICTVVNRVLGTGWGLVNFLANGCKGEYTRRCDGSRAALNSAACRANWGLKHEKWGEGMGLMGTYRTYGAYDTDEGRGDAGLLPIVDWGDNGGGWLRCGKGCHEARTARTVETHSGVTARAVMTCSHCLCHREQTDGAETG